MTHQSNIKEVSDLPPELPNKADLPIFLLMKPVFNNNGERVATSWAVYKHGIRHKAAFATDNVTALSKATVIEEFLSKAKSNKRQKMH